MHIILGSEVAEKLKENYTVLELETFDKDDRKITAYCVVDQVPIMELPNLEAYKNLHSEFVKNYYKGDYNFCKDAAEHLMGKFNGDLDSFYEVILEKMKPL